MCQSDNGEVRLHGRRNERKNNQFTGTEFGPDHIERQYGNGICFWSNPFHQVGVVGYDQWQVMVLFGRLCSAGATESSVTYSQNITEFKDSYGTSIRWILPLTVTAA
jgi:hypothetical protein